MDGSACVAARSSWSCVSRSPISCSAVAEVGDRRVVRVEQPALGEERVHERVVQRAFDRLAELGARHEDRVNVHAVGIERTIDGSTFLSSIVTSTRSMSDFAHTCRATGCRRGSRQGSSDPS